jgi:hypothetical protein
LSDEEGHMAKRIVRLVLALVFLVSVSRPVNAYMDCYPGKIYPPVKGITYPICFIDSDNECMYCVVRKFDKL